MKNSVKSLLVAAAVTGLLGATIVPMASAEDQKPAATAKDKNSCKSANGCSGKDAKAKKASKKDKKEAAAKDKNSCKSANGCSSKDEKKN
jgi:hypothetical protein